jgi:hypothetical protein
MAILVLAGCDKGIPLPPKGFWATLPPPTATVVNVAAQIELDVFSGMPNPTWQLSGTETIDLRNKLLDLPAIPEQTFEEPLGYRGIKVRFTDATGEVTLRVWRGVAQKRTVAGLTFYADQNRVLEDWLLQSGKPYISSDLFSTIQTEISP